MMTDAEKERILREFSEKISQQEDLDPRFAKIIDENFWELVDNGKEDL